AATLPISGSEGRRAAFCFGVPGTGLRLRARVWLCLKTGGLLICGLYATQPACAQDAVPAGPVVAAPAAAASAPLNFRMVVSEEFLNRLIARDETRTQDFRDQFLDTQVAGRQMTTTHLGIDLQPCKSGGRWLMVLSGDTSSSTAGYPPQAVIVHS